MELGKKQPYYGPPCTTHQCGRSDIAARHCSYHDPYHAHRRRMKNTSHSMRQKLAWGKGEPVGARQTAPRMHVAINDQAWLQCKCDEILMESDVSTIQLTHPLIAVSWRLVAGEAKRTDLWARCFDFQMSAKVYQFFCRCVININYTRNLYFEFQKKKNWYLPVVHSPFLRVIFVDF